MNNHHECMLSAIRRSAGKGTKHTLLDNYFGTVHPRYTIDNPTLRKIACEWMKENNKISLKEFLEVITHFIKGESYSEKIMGGMVLDYAPIQLRVFNVKWIEKWLHQLEGWAEVDTLCTSKFINTSLPSQWEEWKPVLVSFSKATSINKRRASLVLFCSPANRFRDERFIEVMLGNISRLQSSKEIFLTKAISWLLRSMVKHYRKEVVEYLHQHKHLLPSFVVRETSMKLKTGKKSAMR